jgi:hypothetical protein
MTKRNKKYKKQAAILATKKQIIKILSLHLSKKCCQCSMPSTDGTLYVWGISKLICGTCLRAKAIRYKDALIDMVSQFAYRGTKNRITTGGLSALEGAFYELGLEDPCTEKDINNLQ